MDGTHTLGYNLHHFLTLCRQQTIVSLLDSCHQAVQLRYVLVAKATGHRCNQANLVQRMVCFRLMREVIQLIAQIQLHLGSRVKNLHLILEETFNALHVILIIKKVIFLF